MTTAGMPDEGSWPASKPDLWDIGRLKEYEKNARRHPPKQLERIANSFREFGFTSPILADETGKVIAGHARLTVAKRLKLKRVPVIVAVGWTEAQKRAYVIADNQLTLGGEWDTDILAMELGDIASDGYDLDALIGFDQNELDVLLGLGKGSAGLTDEDETPAQHDIAISVPGDVWILGKNRLVCGDSTDPLVVKAVLGDVVPHLMVTDPPYGVDYDPGWRTTARNGDGKLLSTGTGRAKGKVQNDTCSDWRGAWSLFLGDVAYVWHGERQLLDMGLQLRDSGFETRNLIVWGKRNLVVGRGHYHSKHETCWYAVKKGATGHWAGDRKQTTLWEIEAHPNDTGHGTQKPVECMRRPMLNNSSAGQAVYDPFCGSGTSIIAAETTGRACHAAEINATYVDLAVRRWQNFTGGTAVLESDGRSFEDVSENRTG